MKKAVSFIAICLFVNLLCGQNLSNGDFERWTSDTTAVGWATNFTRSYAVTSFTYSAGERSLQSHSGWSAMRIHPRVISLWLTTYRLPGLCHLGEFDTSFDLSNLSGILSGGFGVIVNNMITGGIPCNQVPHSIKVWVRYTPGGGDKMNITVRCFNGGTVVAEGNYENSEAFDTYQHITIPVTITDTTTASATMNIIFSCGNKEGSSLLIDDVELCYTDDDDDDNGDNGDTGDNGDNGDNGENGISEPCNVIFSVVPNPASDRLTITPTVAGSYYAVLFDQNGKKVWEGQQLQGTTQVDVTSFSKGIYFLKVSANGLSRTEKIIVK